MELGTEEIIAAKSSTEPIDVVACSNGVGTQLRIIGVYIIDLGAFVNVLEEGSTEISNLIPTHVRNLFNRQLTIDDW